MKNKIQAIHLRQLKEGDVKSDGNNCHLERRILISSLEKDVNNWMELRGEKKIVNKTKNF